MNNKYILFTLLAGFIMANAAQLDITDPTSVTKGVSTGEASPMQFLKDQLHWNRSSKHDPHITVPYFNGKQLKINIAQVVTILLPLLIRYLIPLEREERKIGDVPIIRDMIQNPTIEDIIRDMVQNPKIKTKDILMNVPKLNRNNASTVLLSLVCAYRTHSAEEKWPLRVISAQESHTQEAKEEKEEESNE